MNPDTHTHTQAINTEIYLYTRILYIFLIFVPYVSLIDGAVWEHGGIQTAESSICQKAVESLCGESQFLQVETHTPWSKHILCTHVDLRDYLGWSLGMIETPWEIMFNEVMCALSGSTKGWASFQTMSRESVSCGCLTSLMPGAIHTH